MEEKGKVTTKGLSISPPGVDPNEATSTCSSQVHVTGQQIQQVCLEFKY